MAGLNDGISGGGGGVDYTTGTFSGAVTLGDAAGDAITVTGTATFAETAVFTSGITSNGNVTLGAGDDLIGSATSDITINTDKFTVAGATGNTVVGGTLTCNGNLSLSAGFDLLGSATSDITINTDKFTVAGATGNTVIAGTLTQDGAATFSAAVTVGVDNTGYDVKFFGATASKFMVWDESADDLILADAVGLQLGGDESTADGFKVEFDGTDTLDINALTAGDHIAVGDTTSTGFTVAAQSVTPNNDDGAASTINVGVTAVDVGAVTNDVNDWITLPALSTVPIGHMIHIACNAAGNFELRTPSGSNEKINTVDSDGTAELLMIDTEMVQVVKVSNADGWIARSFTALGATNGALTPD